MDLSVEAICLIPTWIRVINGVRFDQTSHRRFILVKSPPCRWWHACASSFRWLNWGRISVWQLETRLVLFRLHRLVHWNGRICNSHFYHTLKESSGGSLTWVSGKFLQRLGRWLGLGCIRNLCSGSRSRHMIVTWLILPVVIRSSQRLSHACVSINDFIQWNCERLIISVIVYLIIPYYLDNRSNSRANTCNNSQLLDGMYLLDINQPSSEVFGES